MSQRANARAAGFTLLELMLSLGLLALIMVILFGSFHAVAASRLQAENRMNADQEGRALIWMMCRELRGTVFTPLVPSHTYMQGQASKQAGMALDSISFSTLDLSHRRALNGFSAEEIVSYYTTPNPKHRGWSLLMHGQKSALLQGNPPRSIQDTILADDVLSLHFRYYNGAQWEESWDSTADPPGQQLPQAVAIEVALAAGRTPTFLATTVSIPMASVQK